MILYGRNAVREALRGKRRLTELWCSERAAREPWIAESGLSAQRVDADELERLCGSGAHQGVCARAEPYPYADAADLLSVEDALIVALDQIQDPQNLGAIARSAECASATGIVLPERRSAEVTPAVCKASAGAVEHLSIARVRNVADFLAAAKRAGCWCYGADTQATVRYDAPDYDGGVVLVLGGESAGLRPRVKAACDELIGLPLRGRVQSLNVAAAASVMLYEILRARDSP